jgi:hypothetical protein
VPKNVGCRSIEAARAEVQIDFAVGNSEAQTRAVVVEAAMSLGLEAAVELEVSVVAHLAGARAENSYFEAASVKIERKQLVNLVARSAGD